ncbi:MAG: hypothetical protein HRU20_31515, partial [Pseudomonadales bacterium]|nr:hypothetical protein [Pseudomonadales bacterium]
MKIRNTLCSTLLLAVAAFSQADTITLSNGKTLQGSFTGREGDTISFDVDGISMSFNAKDVKAISMGDAAPASAAPAQAAAPQAAAKPAGPVEIPAGTKFTLRLNETLDTGKHASGHKFTAVLEGALVSNGVTVAPQGTRIYGVISEAKKARRVAGNAKMMLTVTDMNIGGQIVPVATSAINAYTQSTTKNSAGKVVRG